MTKVDENSNPPGDGLTGSDVRPIEAADSHPQHTTTPAKNQGGELTLQELLAESRVSRNGQGTDSQGDSHESRESRFKPLHADELDALPPIRWLIKGEIPEGSFTLIYGPTESGKSFLALDYAFRIAQHSPVVYIAAEGALGYAARKLAWCKHHGLPAGQLYFIAEAPSLLDERQVEELLAVLRPLKPVLVVIDTLARSMLGGDENSAQDMGLFVAACDRIRHATGATVMPIHHTGRNGGHERGSTALRAASDQVISVENDDGLIKLSCEKSKDSRAFPARAMRLVIVETGRLQEDGEPETSCVLLPSDQVIITGTLTKNGRTLLETLALDVFQQAGGRARTLIETTGIKPGTFYRIASQLIRDGYVRQDTKGDPYWITENGLKRLTVA